MKSCDTTVHECVLTVLLNACVYGGAGKLSLLSMVRILRDVAHGMAFLEHNHWVHADLATRNLLVGANTTVLCVGVSGVNTSVLCIGVCVLSTM